MRKVKNETTGQIELRFNAKLLSISDTTLTNTNGKNYKVATVEFADKDGVIQKTSAIVYEGNYKKGMKIGETYMTTARQADDNVYLQISHLVGTGDLATLDMFDFGAEEAPQTIQTKTLAGEINS